MKHTKIFFLLIFCLFLNIKPVCAEISIGLPMDFIYEITRGFGFGEDLNSIEKILVKQIVNFKPKNYSKRALIKYLVSTGYFKKISSNKLLEPKSGATFEFEKCKKNSCPIIVDLNGDKAPNEVWKNVSHPKDIINLKIEKDDNNNPIIVLPDFWQ